MKMYCNKRQIQIQIQNQSSTRGREGWRIRCKARGVTDRVAIISPVHTVFTLLPPLTELIRGETGSNDLLWVQGRVSCRFVTIQKVCVVWRVDPHSTIVSVFLIPLIRLEEERTLDGIRITLPSSSLIPAVRRIERRT